MRDELLLAYIYIRDRAGYMLPFRARAVPELRYAGWKNPVALRFLRAVAILFIFLFIGLIFIFPFCNGIIKYSSLKLCRR